MAIVHSITLYAYLSENIAKNLNADRPIQSAAEM